MTRTTRLLALALIAFTPALTGCIIMLPYPFHEEIAFQQTADFSSLSELAVDTRNGGIDIRCEPGRKDVDIRGVRYANGVTLEDARKAAEQVEIAVGPAPEKAERLAVTAKFPEGDWGRSRGARFEIVMPLEAGLQLDTRNGRVIVRGPGRNVNVHTSNGRIELYDVGGDAVACTTNGPIHATNVAGDLDVETSNGTIRLDRVGHSRIRAVTSNGPIRVADAVGSATLRSSNGSIEFRSAALPDAPQVSAITSNGHVVVEVPASVNATVRMRTTNGRVDTHLKDVTMRNFESGRSHFTATLNAGGGDIEIQSSNGSVSLRTTAPESPAQPVS